MADTQVESSKPSNGPKSNGPKKHPVARRRAVVIIHGIGEQRPMETLRTFFQAAFDREAGAKRRRYYSKPDTLSEGFELRRLIDYNGNLRTDYYELYWAHLMPIAATSRLTAWFWTLLWRPVHTVPRRFQPLWWLSWTMLIIAVGLAIASAVSFFAGNPAQEELPWGLAIALAFVWGTVRAYAGDAAVYLSPDPRNVEARNRIRSAALSLIERLHQDSRYERIVIVGHSLGSVIGYDALTYAWQHESDAQRTRLYESPEGTPRSQGIERQRAEAKVRPSSTPLPAEEWQRHSAALLAEQQGEGVRWRITDFVTLGSPLAHGDLLLARGRKDFDRRIYEYELPTCPPATNEPNKRFSYKVWPPGGEGEHKGHVLHHAAGFALTRWTNFYFPCRWLLWGDLVGGPVAPMFGSGVLDVPVSTCRWGGLLAHTAYWVIDPRNNGRPDDPIAHLRKVLEWDAETA